MAGTMARAIHGIPVIPIASRDTEFPTPGRDQRFEDRSTGDVWKYDGVQWVLVRGGAYGTAIDLRRLGLSAGSSSSGHAAIAAEIASMPPTGLTFLVPPGAFTLDWLVQSSLAGPVTFLGVGPQSALKLKASSTVAGLNAIASTATAALKLANLTLDGNRSNQGGGIADLVVWGGGAPLIVEDVAITGWNARAINCSGDTPGVRMRGITTRDAGETADATLAGGTGVLDLPSATGNLDIGEWDCVHGAPGTNSRAPYGLQIQGTSAQLMGGIIENMYFERYGHQSAGANPLGCIDVYNYGSQLTLRNITARSPSYCLVKFDNSDAPRIENARIIGQNHNFAAPAIQVPAGNTHGVNGVAFHDFDIDVYARDFTAGAVVHVLGATALESKRARVRVRARSCFQAILADYLDGAEFDVVADGSTSTLAADAVISIGAGCKNDVNVLAKIRTSAGYPIYATGASIDLHVLPGSRFEDSTLGNHIRGDTIRSAFVEHATFRGTTTSNNNVHIATASGTVRVTDCDAVAGTKGFYSSVGTLYQKNNSWQAKPGQSADRGDASVTLVLGTDFETQRFDTTLTANRTVTLPSAGSQTAFIGDRFKIVRSGLGAFTLTVQDATPTTLKAIPNSTAAVVEVEYTGTAWKLVGYQLL